MAEPENRLFDGRHDPDCNWQGSVALQPLASCEQQSEQPAAWDSASALYQHPALPPSLFSFPWSPTQAAASLTSLMRKRRMSDMANEQIEKAVIA